MWNFLYQYNDIYKRKKKVQTEDWKKKKNVATVATVPLDTVATFQNMEKNNNTNNNND